jgi:hypothetical protein
VQEPTTGPAAEVIRRAETGGDIQPARIYPLELYPARWVLVFRRGLLFTQPAPGRNILQRAARPSREGAFP